MVKTSDKIFLNFRAVYADWKIILRKLIPEVGIQFSKIQYYSFLTWYYFIRLRNFSSKNVSLFTLQNYNSIQFYACYFRSLNFLFGHITYTALENLFPSCMETSPLHRKSLPKNYTITSSFLNQLQTEWNEFLLEVSHSTPVVNLVSWIKSHGDRVTRHTLQDINSLFTF